MSESANSDPVSSPLSSVAPDDSGSDTFARYRYQAQVAIPLALTCAMRESPILSVILEHFEDIAVECSAGWRFIQVKTRDAGLRPWRLVDLCGASGGLNSLLRSFRSLQRNDATYELWLEGAIERRDAAEGLLDEAGRSSSGVLAAVGAMLGIEAGECAAFLAQLRVRPGLPSRQDIGPRVFRLLCTQAPRLPAQDVDLIQRQLTDLLCRAMAADLALGEHWPHAVLDQGNPHMLARVEAKRVTSVHLGPLIAPLLREPQALLRRVLDVELPAATVLEEKLLAGGATEDIVRDAKNLRYLAALREATNASSALFDDDSHLEDVRTRLQVRANAARAVAGGAQAPATQTWLTLIGLLGSQAAQLDANGLFSRDPDILLGEVCEMSDLCQVEWGVAGA